MRLRAMRAALPRPIRDPRLPVQLDPYPDAVLASDGVIERCRVEGGAFARAAAESLRFDGVHLVGTAFDESRLPRVQWLDVLCERSTLTVVDWRGARLTRVIVRGCRMTGAKLVEAELDDVRFVDCQMDYASFAGARTRQVAFESCRLREADFHSADLAGTDFASCDLEGADLGHAKLKGADVSTSQIRGVIVGPADVRGLAVSREQACALAKLFGLVVRD